jgi:predicted TIM-barrel fold metal-dependent hydrolase
MTPPQIEAPRISPPADFVDAHIHLWRLGGDISYDWVLGDDGGMLGTQSEIAIKDWGADRFSAESRFHSPAKTVHIQASDPPTNPVEETRWLVDQQTPAGLPTAIVGRADLRDVELSTILDAHAAASSDFRGIRDMSTMGALDDPTLLPGLAELEKRALSWEANSTWEQADDLIGLARQAPNLSIVYGHTGWPVERSEDYFRHWRDSLSRLAACDNVTCKISGLGMTDHEWTVASMSPYVQAALEAFGADRCMFGSNWPVDRIYASYDALVTAMATQTNALSAAETHAFWAGTATRVYQLN